MKMSLTIEAHNEEECQVLAEAAAALSGLDTSSLDVSDAAAAPQPQPTAAPQPQPTAAPQPQTTAAPQPQTTAAPAGSCPEPTRDKNGDITRDSAGTPYYNEIHAKNGGKMGDGTWKLQRGIDREGARKTEELLRATYPEGGDDAASPPGAPAPRPTPQPEGAAPQPSAAPSVPEVQDALNTAFNQGALSVDDFNALYQRVGVRDILTASPEQLAALYAEATSAMALRAPA